MDHPPNRFYTSDEVCDMLDDDYFEPCCMGSEDDLSTDELTNSECER